MSPRWRSRFDRIAPWLLLLMACVAIYGAAGTYVNGRADAERQAAATKQNADNAVTNCQNANESREASRSLWNYVIDLSLANGKTSPDRAAFIDDFRAWINVVYQPHDCAHLDRKYVIPPPPSIPAA